ncbi:hypothetical protein NC99_43920 [Sunxiuqinia dokdonensis]|uniref:Uncharacterized protein n=1 Tax=Sunxiuqinia dokdonensis TaxID=1409788 RepID=A0A0L8V343_9BACT|nr:hypothetical protein NC99_43920 [Sunxiuqinia dokdonensis]
MPFCLCTFDFSGTKSAGYLNKIGKKGLEIGDIELNFKNEKHASHCFK